MEWASGQKGTVPLSPLVLPEVASKRGALASDPLCGVRSRHAKTHGIEGTVVVSESPAHIPAYERMGSFLYYLGRVQVGSAGGSPGGSLGVGGAPAPSVVNLPERALAPEDRSCPGCDLSEQLGGVPAAGFPGSPGPVGKVMFGGRVTEGGQHPKLEHRPCPPHAG